MDTKYKQYVDIINSVLQNDNLNGFKSTREYREIVETLEGPHGNLYYECLKNIFSNDVILEFCNKNDSIGSPIKYYINGLNSSVSSVSLRYLFHAYLSLKHMQSLGISSVNIVEIGCGYGGLCVAVDYVSKIMNITITSYTCIDLDSPLKLQEKYIGLFKTYFPVKFHSASTFGSAISGTNNFLISNYCFSEIGPEFRQKYIETLIPKVSNGFMTWNYIPVYNFGKELIKVEREIPQDRHLNFYVYF